MALNEELSASNTANTTKCEPKIVKKALKPTFTKVLFTRFEEINKKVKAQTTASTRQVLKKVSNKRAGGTNPLMVAATVVGLMGGVIFIVGIVMILIGLSNADPSLFLVGIYIALAGLSIMSAGVGIGTGFFGGGM